MSGAFMLGKVGSDSTFRARLRVGNRLHEKSSLTLLFLPADVAHLDFRQRGGRRGSKLRVAVGALAPDRGDRIGELGIARTLAQRRLEIEAFGAKQARVHLAVRRQPRAGAVAAERLRDRRDDADLAFAVAVTPALGDLAAIVRI